MIIQRKQSHLIKLLGGTSVLCAAYVAAQMGASADVMKSDSASMDTQPGPGSTVQVDAPEDLNNLIQASLQEYAVPPVSEGQPWMALGELTTTPYGQPAFCNAHPDDCAYTTDTLGYTIYDDVASEQLQHVNLKYNRAITPATDEDNYSQDELWTYASENGYRGDCEDYVLDKRRALINMGWDPSSLLVAIVHDLRLNGSGHALLIARTDRGDLVLDNMTDEILRWDRTFANYHFIKVSAPERVIDWRYVEPYSGLPATASILQPATPVPTL
jgi:predicted transglutaminase-like cysteine proteinase